MIVAYGLISRELYRGIQFELGQNAENTGEIIKNKIQTALKGSWPWKSDFTEVWRRRLKSNQILFKKIETSILGQ